MDGRDNVNPSLISALKKSQRFETGSKELEPARKVTFTFAFSALRRLVFFEELSLVTEATVNKAALRHAFSACVYCMQLRFQRNYVGWLKPK